VLFTDLVDSTAVAERVGDRRWAELLDQHDHVAEQVVTGHGGKLVKSTGDGVLATFTGPSPALRTAVAMRSELSDLGLQMRAGIHAGEVEDRDGNISGFAVNLAARVEGAAPDGDIYVTSTVRDLLLGGSFNFEYAGSHDLKGIDGSWHLCRLL
jgi:class 3 adenylate cyclase